MTLLGRCFCAVFAVLVTTAAPIDLQAAPKWTPVGTTDGVAVSGRDVPGQNLDEFQGISVINENMFQLLAVIDDIPRHCEWRARCHSTRLIEQRGLGDRVLYTRTDAPWPVSDRDTVLHATVEVDVKKRTVWSRFSAVVDPRQPPVDSVVRMPRLRGFYKLVWLAENRTEVTYRVNADPGGLLPTWLAQRTSRKIPVGTLTGLRKQAVKMAGRYEAFRDRFDPARQAKQPN